MISLEALLITAVLSIDVFAMSFAYGSGGIKIPFRSMMVITVIGSVILATSLYFGVLMQPFISSRVTAVISFGVLFTLGIVKIFDSVIKYYIRKHGDSKKLEFSVFNLKFILNIYAAPEKADVDGSKVISPKEAVAVAIAVAMDALVIGFGAGLTKINHLQIVVFSVVLTVFAIIIGSFLGRKIAQRFTANLSWVAGVILIALAVV
jgi:putative sporulation protein YtaF